ncbi:DUF3644 domain-containing protein [bacterium D16-50]|nr:DUF3644 domain-containing protein [bacterium D16-50]
MTLAERLLEKSKEAFTMSIELYNKPTIKYRVEGFSMFICNSWELMLKAYMLKTFGDASIYYSDAPDRTLALSDCVKKVFTNNKDPLRINLEKIIELRNTSTHLIVEEYEMVYVPLFQACVLNFNTKMMEFHDIDMTEVIPQNFLTLSVSLKSLNESEISAKYPEIVCRKLFTLKKTIEDLESMKNSKFAININVNHYMTKDPKQADATFRIAKDGEEPVAIIKEVKRPELIFKYSTKTSIETITSIIKRQKITLQYHNEPVIFNKYHFSNLIKYYGIKDNSKFCWKYTVGNTDFFRYSQQAIDFLAEELKRDPLHILDNIKK